MSEPNLESVLNDARKLPPEEQQQLIEQLRLSMQIPVLSARTQAALAIVERTFGVVAGVDRETLISIAEDEEFCGY